MHEYECNCAGESNCSKLSFAVIRQHVRSWMEICKLISQPAVWSTLKYQVHTSIQPGALYVSCQQQLRINQPCSGPRLSPKNLSRYTVQTLEHCALYIIFWAKETRNQYLVVIKMGCAIGCAIGKLFWREPVRNGEIDSMEIRFRRGQVSSYRAGPGEKLPHIGPINVQCLKALCLTGCLCWCEML